jgi:hypothetical protein
MAMKRILGLGLGPQESEAVTISEMRTARRRLRTGLVCWELNIGLKALLIAPNAMRFEFRYRVR